MKNIPVHTLMLVVTREEQGKKRELLLENGLILARNFKAKFLIGCPDSEVLDLEKRISNSRKHHRNFPLIQICPIIGNFSVNLLEQAEQYHVDLIVMCSSQGEQKGDEFLSPTKKKIVSTSGIYIMMLPVGRELKQNSIKNLDVYKAA